MNPDEMIAVIQAHKEGKTVQYRVTAHWGSGKWRDLVGNPQWNFGSNEYRIKPEPRQPRVIYVNEYPRDGDSWGGAYSDRDAAEYQAGSRCIATRKFIEVIEEEA